ncbi:MULTISPECIES: hypothetical protein [unclassified Pseudoalteromonas]|uniref:hypothetical protein n=1 Tax=unclassified Pseudoalteromonas TaxID=194690 RepID=UPI00209776BA|nr:hypothetical protein [Pseudoalteromonas sp. XMcav2-N]MCO7187584.1 hypothetical protein [Pseudoalteromonas sp. XMcav2-N]
MKIIKILLVIVFAATLGIIFFHQTLISSVLLPQYISWAEETDIQGRQIGEPLDQKHLAIAKEIGIQSPEKVRIVYVDEVPFPHDNFALKTLGEALGFVGEGIINNAQVIGYSIYVRHGFELTTPKLAHELVHVLQIERSSLQAIVTQHFSDLAEYGYDNSPLEVEAFKANEIYKDR